MSVGIKAVDSLMMPMTGPLRLSKTRVIHWSCFQRVITLSLATMNIIKALPVLDILSNNSFPHLGVFSENGLTLVRLVR